MKIISEKWSFSKWNTPICTHLTTCWLPNISTESGPRHKCSTTLFWTFCMKFCRPIKSGEIKVWTQNSIYYMLLGVGMITKILQPILIFAMLWQKWYFFLNFTVKIVRCTNDSETIFLPSSVSILSSSLRFLASQFVTSWFWLLLSSRVISFMEK